MSVHNWKRRTLMDTARSHAAQSNGPRTRICPGHGPFSQAVAGVGFEPTQAKPTPRPLGRCVVEPILPPIRGDKGTPSAAPQKSLRGSWRLLRVVAGAGEIEGAGGVEGQAGVAGEAAVQQDGVGVAVGAGL